MPLKILILGGTVFLGRHMVEAALERGHEVTLFNRGKSGPDLFPDLETVNGDRSTDLDRIEGGRFDVVLDPSCYFPRDVVAAAKAFDAIGRYIFISSVSAYEDLHTRGMDESAPLCPWQEAYEELTEVEPEAYGALKAECERRLLTAFGARATIVRPGLIVGPYDRSGRFSYWPHRFSVGGSILLPDAADTETQIIDVRDLAEWIIRLGEDDVTGTFNGVGPRDTLTLKDVFRACRAHAAPETETVEVSETFLQEEGVAPWTELPLWLPSGLVPIGFDSVSLEAAIGSGLTFRPLDMTLKDTLASIRAEGFHAGSSLTRAREAELLAKWADRQQ